jgi:hypothetical protein
VNAGDALHLGRALIWLLNGIESPQKGLSPYDATARSSSDADTAGLPPEIDPLVPGNAPRAIRWLPGWAMRRRRLPGESRDGTADSRRQHALNAPRLTEDGVSSTAALDLHRRRRPCWRHPDSQNTAHPLRRRLISVFGGARPPSEEMARAL